jgi:mycofactocin system glycosyltransferase
VAVVIPVHNDPSAIAATLTALGFDRTAATPAAVSDGASPRSVYVVDDFSDEPDLIADRCRAGAVTLIRRETRGGPAGARNVGWRSATEPLIAFVDANCEPEPGWLDRLLPHFADPQVAAVAPRIVPSAGVKAPRVVAAYEAVASPLDLGGREAAVRPRSPVAYVPTAALVVRREALEELGGFDESLPVGEDVDFVWRLVAAGWTVRYEPRATVRHPVRPSWSAWLAQRYRYGTSAAPLARRHGVAVAPAVMSPWTAASWGLAAAGHPVLGAATACYPAAALTGPLPLPAALRLAGIGHLRGGLALARAVRRAWAPAAIAVAVASRRSRPLLAAVAVTPGLLDWFDRRPGLDPARFVAVRLADDLSYAAGVWAGCVRQRSARALLPDLAVRGRARWDRLGGPTAPATGGPSSEDQSGRLVLPAGEVGGHRGRPRRAPGQ